MQEILGNVGKVVVDSQGQGQNLIYVPLGQMLQNAGKTAGSQGSGSPVGMPKSLPGAAASGQNSSSDRGNRPTRSRESNR